jgi:septum formation protein
VGIFPDIYPADVDESPQDNEDPINLVKRVTLLKATTISARYKKSWVLAADTVVVIDDEVLGKPQDEKDAERMLMKISGRMHTVITGYALIGPSDLQVTFNNLSNSYRPQVATEEAKVTFSELSPHIISAYIATGEPLDKAGAYALQGIGSAFVESIIGAPSTVIGLPLSSIIGLLERAGVLAVN